MECKVVGSASSGLVTSGRTQQRQRNGRVGAVECLDLETGIVIKRYPHLKGVVCPAFSALSMWSTPY